MAEVVLVEPRPEWAAEFVELAALLHDALGGVALRIDHIGSTSVPGLLAKDVLDVQVIVNELLPLDELLPEGFLARLGGVVVADHVPDGWKGPASAWDKRLYARLDGPAPPAHVHVRVRGGANERYALLFRDYLRANDAARDRWAAVKARVAAETGDRDAYAVAKDALTDQLMADAERWAEASGWSIPPL